MPNDQLLTSGQESFIKHGVEAVAAIHLLGKINKDQVPGKHTILVHNDADYAATTASVGIAMCLILGPGTIALICFYVLTGLLFTLPAIPFLEHHPANDAIGVPIVVVSGLICLRYVWWPITRRLFKMVWTIIKGPNVLPAHDYQGRIFSERVKQEAAQYIAESVKQKNYPTVKATEHQQGC